MARHNRKIPTDTTGLGGKSQSTNSIIRKLVIQDCTAEQIADVFGVTPQQVVDYCQQNNDKIMTDDTPSPPHTNWYLKQYGLTTEQYNAMYREQKGRCKICDKNEEDNKRRLAIDHCHKGGQVRGLLCSNCNTALGLMEDDPNILQMAMLYLKGAL